MKSQIKILVGMALGAALLSGTATSARAEILFRGLMEWTAVNAACAGGPRAGDQDNARYHPAVAPGNFNFAALNRIWRFGATSFALETGSFTTAFKQVSNVSIGWSDYTPDRPSFVRLTQSPATITSTTPNVTLVGQIKNPWGEIGLENCIVDFRMVGLKSD